jgi:phosphomannomutase
MLAALHTLAAMAEQDRPLSALLGEFSRYVSSGELNSTVGDADEVLRRLEKTYADVAGVEVDDLDGLTVTHADWWFNVRPSNTEPLLRLNVEGVDRETMTAVREQVLGLIRSET